MYIRVKTTPNSPRKSIQIVEGKRVGNKVKQRIVHYVGIAMDEREEQKLKDYGQELIAKIIAKRTQEVSQLSLLPTLEKDALVYVKNKRGRKVKKRLSDILPPSEVTLVDIKEKERIVEGIHEVGKVIYDMLGCNTILQKCDDNILRDLVLTRLAHPASKHKTQRILNKQFGKEHNLDAMYRMMDKLYEKIDLVKKLTFDATHSLFPQKIDLLLFDVTTLYFETTKTDELRKFGYSKDCRFNTTQVVLALATNEEGLPIGYELFAGNKAEVKTLTQTIEHWRTIFNIGSICFVGDRAMFTRDNLKILDEYGYNYIVAAKLRSLAKEIQAKILDEKNYRPKVLKNELAWISDMEYEDRRLIVSYKKRRAIQDDKEREQVLNKIRKLIGSKGPTSKLISNRGVKKFTVTDENAKTVLDEERIAADALWDGLHGVITNIKKDKAESIIARYANLWIIEESFRIKKHLLKIKPIFHWKPNRIHAHIAICYMAFAVLRRLQYCVALTQKISPEIIIEELLQVEASIHEHKRTKDLYRIPGKFTNIARKIYKAVNITRSEDATVYIT
jgi:transposase